MSIELRDYDPADALETPEAVSAFLADALDTGDAGYIARALGVAARSRGMTAVARETGLSREQLYRSFSAKGNPTLRSTLALLRALGLRIAVLPEEHAQR